MEHPSEVLAAYAAALPDDSRVERKKMFGMPCAFVNRQMFFGTFGDTLVARVGPARAASLVDPPSVRVFEPSEGRPWSDYVQVDGASDPAFLQGLAAEALAWTLKLPAKVKPPKSAKRATRSP